MKIGDRVKENVKQPRTMLLLLAGQPVLDDGVPLWVEVAGTIESVGRECGWHVDWDDGRRTDQNETYAQGKRKGEPCLIPAE